MPKEVIYGEPISSSWDSERAVVELGWDSDTESVQLVTKYVRSEARTAEGPISVPEEALIRDGEQVVGVAWPASDEELSPMQEGSYVDLDRKAINLLIRHLRRARNQVFGEDA